MSNITVKTMAQFMAEGKQPEVLFWVGCAGSFDDRAKKIIRAFVKKRLMSSSEILTHEGNERIEHGFYRAEQLMF